MNREINDEINPEVKEDVGVVILVNSSEVGRGKDKALLPGNNSIRLIREKLNNSELTEITERLSLILKEIMED